LTGSLFVFAVCKRGAAERARQVSASARAPFLLSTFLDSLRQLEAKLLWFGTSPFS
jgi:hypothetical protein